MRSGSLISLCGLGLLLALSPAMEATHAALTARTANPGALFAATALYAPANLQGNPVARGAALSWTAGQNGSGYKVLGLGNGTSATCPADTDPGYTPIGTTTTLSYTDANRSPDGVPQGTWYCYQVQTAYQSWNSVQNNPVKGVQVGVVANTLQLINGGSAGKLDTGDQIIITFNQAIDPNSGPTSGNTVCSNTNTIWIGSAATGGGCATTETVRVGKLTGGTLDQNARWAATYTWSNGNTKLAVTLGTRVFGPNNAGMSASTWTYTPTTDSSKLLSASGLFHICDSNTDGGNCTPSTTGSTGPSGGEQSTPTLSATSTRTIAASPTATATATSTAQPSLETTSTPTATATTTATSTVIETATTYTTATATATATATVTVTAVKTITPAPRQTTQPTHTASSTPTKAEISPTQIVPAPTLPISDETAVRPTTVYDEGD